MEGKELKNKVNEEIFWRKAIEIVKLVEPLVKVLWLVDGERLAMGFIYEAMDQAKEQIKRAYKDKVAKYGPIWVTTFTNASGTFEKNLAKIAREANEPAQWWEAFGSHCPELQTFAIRILSQTCNATSCEHNWSAFERIHTKKRNRLDKKWLNDLVYVQYNLWLRRNQLLNKRLDLNPIVLEDIDPTSDWVVESHPAEFYFDEDLDLDLQGEASLEHDVQLNADPDPLVLASASQLASPPIAGASSAQPRQKRNDISHLSQLTSVAQPVRATTSTVAVGDDDDEETWGPLSDSNDDLEIDPHDLGSSGSSY
eukprot:PITA_19344